MFVYYTIGTNLTRLSWVKICWLRMSHWSTCENYFATKERCVRYLYDTEMMVVVVLLLWLLLVVVVVDDVALIRVVVVTIVVVVVVGIKVAEAEQLCAWDVPKFPVNGKVCDVVLCVLLCVCFRCCCCWHAFNVVIQCFFGVVFVWWWLLLLLLL